VGDRADKDMQTDHRPSIEDTVKDQATAWVMRLTSGQATAEDAAALRRWRNESALHRQAFADAKLLWQTLEPAAKAIAFRGEDESALHRRGLVGRRALIGGALAASAAAVGYFGSRPPLNLWPSIDELRADYRTGTGEQRQLVLTSNVSMLLNTQTSIDVRSLPAGSHGIELITGEAAITADAPAGAPFVVVAAGGRASTTSARFDIRRDGATVRVTSRDGEVEVAQNNRFVTVPSGHQVTYDGQNLGAVSPVELAIATAWQHGVLIFRHEPLRRVVAEVNRYRPGRIIVLDDTLGSRDVVASFHLDRIDEVVEHVMQAFGARATFLPAGVVLLS
jgi:transmembrane sensor